MPLSLQVIYPVGEHAHFDHDYYAATHMSLVHRHMGTQIQHSVITKGLARGPDSPPGFYAIATFVFAGQEEMDATMANAGPVLADLPNFTDT
ncbi:EthD family reductase [Thalassococcus sp. S3]|uniref:EthD family reductase n=1 Tax=Thalassococcus sp. S3 TaxID=2017482 RepID=UPI00102486B9|nr:EthD family reductase [Thalassococcus sp. S3]QBF30404.1 ethyl tert-butyl ether degradation protein EthD [Thalassococcus sp. S3]